MDELDFDWWCCNLTAKSPISCFNEQFNTQVETTIWAGTYFHNYLSPPGRYWMNVCVKVGFVEGGSLFFSFVLTRDRMWSENTFSRLTSSINSLPSTVDCISSIIKCIILTALLLFESWSQNLCALSRARLAGETGWAPGTFICFITINYVSVDGLNARCVETQHIGLTGSKSAAAEAQPDLVLNSTLLKGQLGSMWVLETLD